MEKIATLLCFLIALNVAFTYDCSWTIQQMVAFNEGSKPCVYKDSLGIPTIGIGFNLQRSDAAQKITALGLNFQNILTGKICLSLDQITKLFNADLEHHSAGAKKCVSTFNQLPSCVQKVLIDMSFNMGPSALCSWPNFIKQLNNKDYAGAANNMKSTTWCSQVKTRCDRNVNLIRNMKLLR